MIKVSVLYPKTDGASFDMEYYKTRACYTEDDNAVSMGLLDNASTIESKEIGARALRSVLFLLPILPPSWAWVASAIRTVRRGRA